MNWNKYTVLTESGFSHEIIMGEWLNPGKYPFGEVRFIRTLTDAEAEEHKDIEDGILSMWYDQLPAEYYTEE